MGTPGLNFSDQLQLWQTVGLWVTGLIGLWFVFRQNRILHRQNELMEEQSEQVKFQRESLAAADGAGPSRVQPQSSRSPRAGTSDPPRVRPSIPSKPNGHARPTPDRLLN
jgi:hypothetical protein